MNSPIAPPSVVELLDVTGHLNAPFGQPHGRRIEPATAPPRAVREAIASYQQYHAGPLEYIATEFWPRFDRPQINVGFLDDPTIKLMSTARCMCPDYNIEGATASGGGGSWAGCHGVGDGHAASVRLLNQPPEFLVPYWSQIWGRVTDCNADIGLRLILTDRDSNIDISFVDPDGGWIGLAVVGVDQTCQSTIWAKFDRNYRPANLVSEWTTLINHELGHNCGLNHSRGGIMNPYILPGLPASWRGDPSFPLLRDRFGGEPIDAPRGRSMVLAWQYPDGKYEVIQTLDTTGGPTGVIWPTETTGGSA